MMQPKNNHQKQEVRLTWIESEQRWRKMYRGHRLSFSGEGGKDASYHAAVEAFEDRKIKIDDARYRKPALPGDAGRLCEFSDDGSKWICLRLAGYCDNQSVWKWCSIDSSGESVYWKLARIRGDA